MKFETLQKRAHIAAENAQDLAEELCDADCFIWADAAKAAAERANYCAESAHEYAVKLARFAKACAEMIKASAE